MQTVTRRSLTLARAARFILSIVAESKKDAGPDIVTEPFLLDD